MEKEGKSPAKEEGEERPVEREVEWGKSKRAKGIVDDHTRIEEVVYKEGGDSFMVETTILFRNE